MELKITISIDDVNPGKGWRILGNPTEKWLRSLNEEFGAKFTLFIPSNYHGKYPLSKHKDWAQELVSIEWLELAAHGHFHMTSDPKKFGECEFLEIDYQKLALQRLELLTDEWMNSLGKLPKIWKNPGWLCSAQSQVVIRQNFQGFSLHYDHNNPEWNWVGKEFFGHDGIQETEVGIHNVDEENPDSPGMIMFTSHIFGDWNDNVWNQTNYEQLRTSLEHLVQQNECTFKTLKECL